MSLHNKLFNHQPAQANSLNMFTNFFVAAQPYFDKISRNELIATLSVLIIPILLILAVLFLTAPNRKQAKQVFTWTVFWLVLSGVIHMTYELFFVFFRSNSGISNAMDLYGNIIQVHILKSISLSSSLLTTVICFYSGLILAAADFRYGHPLEAGTAAMEAITAVIVGPLCFLLAYSIVHNTSYRYIVQVILCTCQMYGLIWFILYPEFNVGGLASIASFDPFLFWVIFFGLNAPWGIFPPVLLYKAVKAINHNFIASQQSIAPLNDSIKIKSAKKNK
jgi:cholestenol delta-isomerase